MKAKGIKAKAKGVVLLEAFLALLLMAMASYGLATVNSVQFSQMAAGKDADNARNYAELEATYIKQLGYESVVTNNKDDDDTSRPPRYPSGQQSTDDKASNARDMAKFLGSDLGSEWRSTVTLGKSIGNINGDSDNKIQNVVVSVYKASDGDSASPRATVTVPLSTQGSIYTKKQVDALFDGLKTKYVMNKYQNGQLAMGWDGSELHYFFNGSEISTQDKNPSPSTFSDLGGYYKFPNGLIVQWGIVYHLPTDDTNRITYFSIPFPHKCFSICSSRIFDKNLQQENQWTVVKSYDNQGFIIYADRGDGATGSISASWIAFGY